MWVNPATLKLIDSWATRTGRSRSWVIALAMGALATAVAKDKEVVNVGKDLVKGLWAKGTRAMLLIGTGLSFLAACKGQLP